MDAPERSWQLWGPFRRGPVRLASVGALPWNPCEHYSANRDLAILSAQFVERAQLPDVAESARLLLINGWLVHYSK